MPDERQEEIDKAIAAEREAICRQLEGLKPSWHRGKTCACDECATLDRAIAAIRESDEL
jgi:hypothetical protein